MKISRLFRVLLAFALSFALFAALGNIPAETSTGAKLTDKPNTPDGKTGTNGGEKNPDNGEKQKCEKCEKDKEPENQNKDKEVGPKPCINLVIPFGGVLNETTLADGKFFIQRQEPSASLFSPQGILYSHALALALLFDETAGLPSGVSREVTISTADAGRMKFQFASGSSEGRPVGEYMSSRFRMRMTDATGASVSASPAFYELHTGTGAMIKFSASAKKVVSFTSVDGRVLAPDSPGVMIEPVYDSEGSIRQVWSGSDGLADLVIIDEYKYEIRLYNPADVGAKTNGLYAVSGTPRTVWSIENPDRNSSINKVRVTKTVGGVSYVGDFEYIPSQGDWSLSKANGSYKSSKSFIWNQAKTDAAVTETVTDADGVVAFKMSKKVRKFSFGEVVTEKIIDPDGAALKTEYSYYENESDPAYGLQKAIKYPDGSWETFSYDSQRREILRVESWLDSPFGFPAAQARATYTSYAPVDPADAPAFNDDRPRTVEVKVLGVTVEKTYYAYKTVSGESVKIEEKCASPSASYGATGNMRRTITSYAPNAGPALAGRVKSVAHPDGRLDLYSFEYGSYNAAPDPANSSFTPGSGSAMRRIITRTSADYPGGVPFKSTREIRVTDSRGDNVLNELHVFNGSSYERAAWTVNSFDSEHHTIITRNSDGSQSSATWTCCSKASETLPDGTELTYSYDLLLRLSARTKKGHGGSPDVVTSYTYDAYGRVLSETVSAGTLSLVQRSEYDPAGRLTKRTAPDGLQTSTAHTLGGRLETTTLPGGFTRITENHADGQTKSVTGSSVVPQYFVYGVETATGNLWTQVLQGSLSSPRHVKTWTDLLGRTVREERPGYNSSLVSQTFHDSRGRVWKQSVPGRADVLASYDEMGSQKFSCLDVNANGSMDLASADRVSESSSQFAKIGADWWRETVSKVYASDNSDVATTVSTRRTRLTGLAAGVVSESISIDIDGNQTVSTVSIDRANKTVTETVNTPESSVDSQNVTVNGLLTSARSSSNLTTTFSYDALGRRVAVADPRTGASSTHYDALGRVDYSQDAAGNRSSYSYEAATGRLASTTDALGQTKTYTYNPLGSVLTERGSSDYPVDFEYNAYGEKTALKTYRESSADTTSWTYHEPSGLLLSKTDAAGKSVSYSYSASGLLASRVWARTAPGGGPLVTYYSYDPKTAELTGVSYSDTTPAVSHTYDRLGRQKTVSDAVGSRTFSYNSALRLDSEAVNASGGGLYSKTITRDYAASGLVGRYAGFHIGTEYDVDYAYDSYGRANSVASGADAFSYSFLANSDLAGSINYPNNISVAYSYEAKRDLMTSVENKRGTATFSKYAYTYDAVGRRGNVVHTGSAFSADSHTDWTYNSRSELTQARKFQGSSVANTISPVYNYNFSFAYDNIGNRTSSTTYESVAAAATTYSSNNLNQYTAVASKTPAYDADGNMLSDGAGWAFAWDAENRLRAAVNGVKALDFKYDHMSRRVEKRVSDGGIVTRHLRFVYDGFKMIQELDAANNNAVRKKIVWSGETPVSIFDAALNATYYYLLDANKNVSELVDASGSVVAHYEYGPFGNITRQSGPYADENPIKFSSEYHDTETNLVYYNYRYYNPTLGRWLSRDPIEEEGGWNLYGFLDNNGISFFDLLGLIDCKKLKKLINDMIDSLKDEVNLSNSLSSTIDGLAQIRFAIGAASVPLDIATGAGLAKVAGRSVHKSFIKANAKQVSRLEKEARHAFKNFANGTGPDKNLEKFFRNSYKINTINSAGRTIAEGTFNSEFKKSLHEELGQQLLEGLAKKTQTHPIENTAETLKPLFKKDSNTEVYLDALNDGEDTFKELDNTATDIDKNYNGNLDRLNKAKEKYRECCR